MKEGTEYFLAKVPVYGDRVDSDGARKHRIILMPKGLDGPELYKLRLAKQKESDVLEVVARGAT